MDTTTINYGIEKIKGTFNEVLPHVQNVSAEYVDYVVTKTILTFSFVSIASIFFVLLSYFLYKISRKCDNYDMEVGFVVSSIFSGIITVIFIIFCFDAGFNMTMALTNPEMYTVEKLLGK